MSTNFLQSIVRRLLVCIGVDAVVVSGWWNERCVDDVVVCRRSVVELLLHSLTRVMH